MYISQLPFMLVPANENTRFNVAQPLMAAFKCTLFLYWADFPVGSLFGLQIYAFPSSVSV